MKQTSFHSIVSPAVAVRDGPPLPPAEQPVQRILSVGPASCSNAELLSALLGQRDSGLGEALLAHFESLHAVLRAEPGELAGVPGLGPASAARLRAAFELGRRAWIALPLDRVTISSPADAAHLLLPEMSLLEQEELRVILLDVRNRVLGIVHLYRGSLDTTMIRVGEVFRDAIRRNAASILFAHNHPSGDPSPSPEDVALTRAVVEAGRLLSIHVIDHLVVGQGRFVSLKERGLGFS